MPGKLTARPCNPPSAALACDRDDLQRFEGIGLRRPIVIFHAFAGTEYLVSADNPSEVLRWCEDSMFRPVTEEEIAQWRPALQERRKAAQQWAEESREEDR